MGHDKNLGQTEEFRRFVVVAPNLLNAFVQPVMSKGAFGLDNGDGNAINKEDDIGATDTRAIIVLLPPFIGDGIDVLGEILKFNQFDIALTLLFLAEDGHLAL